MPIKLVTPPTAEPLSLDQAKAHLRELSTDQDTSIEELIAEAREQFEAQTWRALCTQTWRLSLRGFPAGGGPIVVPRPPLQSVTSILYIAVDGSELTLGPAAYTVHTDAEPGEIEPVYGTSWPQTRDVPGAVEVTYVAGFGDPAEIPVRYLRALKLVIGHWYENRESVVTGTIASALPQAFDAIFETCRIRDERLRRFLVDR